jgi:hypothetical protein
VTVPKRRPSPCTFVKAYVSRYGALPFDDVFRSGGSFGPEKWTWLEKLFAAELGHANPYEDLHLDALHADPIDEDTLEVEIHLVGDEQEPDTEVPRYVSDRDVRRKLVEMGAVERGTARKPARLSSDWQIREHDFGYGRTLYTTYTAYATFRLTACIPGWKPPQPDEHARKTPAQLDREIRALLRAKP